jgi:hypothetical protein
MVFAQSHIGGKIFCLSSSLPSVGAGALKPRDDTKLLGTGKVGFPTILSISAC